MNKPNTTSHPIQGFDYAELRDHLGEYIPNAVLFTSRHGVTQMMSGYGTTYKQQRAFAVYALARFRRSGIPGLTDEVAKTAGRGLIIHD